MEQERYPDYGPNPGMYGSDRDIFQRVWRRVMPEEREDYPLEMLPEPDHTLAVTNNPPASFAMPAIDGHGEDFPAKNDALCLGAGSAMYGKLLQEFIAHELKDCKLYHTLARRAGAGASCVLSAIAADEYRHAKRLSTAYFLISGVLFWPDRLPAPVIDSYMGELRRRFAGELQGEADYLAAAAETNDHCLYELYLELADDEAKHAQLIRTILEQL